MKALRNYIDKIKPNFEEGGKYQAFRSVFDGFETFLFVPNTTSKTGTHIHDAIDSKRIMSIVVIALIPALLFGMYNLHSEIRLRFSCRIAKNHRFIRCRSWNRVRCSSVEEGRNSGRFPCFRYVDSYDCSC